MLRPMDPLESFQSALRGLRKGELSRISEETGIDLTRLSGYKNGRKTDLQISTFVKIAKAMGRSADELLGLEKPAPSRSLEAAFREAESRAEKAEKRVSKVLAALGLAAPGPTPVKREKPEP